MSLGKINVETISEVTPVLTDQLYRLSLQLSPQTQRETFSDVLQKLISHSNAHLFVARLNSGLAAGMLTMISYPSLTGQEKTWIEDVVVGQNARGMGIGEKLVKHAINEAKQQGILQLNLTSNPTRVAANKLYQKLGFQIYDTNYYRYTVE